MTTPPMETTIDNSHLLFVVYFGLAFLGLMTVVMVDDWMRDRSKERRRAQRRKERAALRRLREEDALQRAQERAQEEMSRQDGFRQVEETTRRVCAPGVTPARPAALVVMQTRHGHNLVSWPLHLN